MLSITHLGGYAPALPTPFRRDGEIDWPSFEFFCDWQIAQGATALVVSGTTGEAPSLTLPERSALIAAAVQVARGRTPVVAGTGSNATEHAIELGRAAEAAGADALLSVMPYYNCPMQAGLFAHFSAIAGATALPVILYDVPARTACSLADNTILRLAQLPGIAGLKDATGDLSRAASLRRKLGPEFRLLSGDDPSALGFLANGGNGCISVTSNLAPALCRRFFEAFHRGDGGQALKLWRCMAPLTAALFVETSPVPLKYALHLRGFMQPFVRLPLVGLGPDSETAIRALLPAPQSDVAEIAQEAALSPL